MDCYTCTALSTVHLYLVKRITVHSSVDRGKVICQEQKDFKKEIKITKQDLNLNGYLQYFINSLIKSNRNNRPFSNRIPHGSVVIPYVRGISEKFQHTGKLPQYEDHFQNQMHTLKDPDDNQTR
jgi:hypothetical protein